MEVVEGGGESTWGRGALRGGLGELRGVGEPDRWGEVRRGGRAVEVGARCGREGEWREERGEFECLGGGEEEWRGGREDSSSLDSSSLSLSLASSWLNLSGLNWTLMSMELPTR